MSEGPGTSPRAVDAASPVQPAPHQHPPYQYSPHQVPPPNQPPYEGQPAPYQPTYQPTYQGQPPYQLPYQGQPPYQPPYQGQPPPYQVPYQVQPYAPARTGRGRGGVVVLVIGLCLALVCVVGVAGGALVSYVARGGATTGAGGAREDGAGEADGGKGDGQAGLTPEERFDEDVQTALAARTTALRARNEKAFLAVVDPTDRTLLARQRQLFRNLVQFSLVDPQFRDVDDGGSASRAVPGGRDFGVALVHRLGKADVSPVAMGYRETWGRRGTAVVLEASTPERGLARSRTPGPIDDTALRVVGGGLVTVAAGPEVTPATLATVDRLAEKAAVPVRRMWGARPGPQGFVVFVTKSKRAKGSWYGGTTVAGSSGFCASLYTAETGAFEEVPLQFGGARIVIDLTRSRGDADLSSTLRHEFTHAQSIKAQAVRQGSASGQAYPLWAEEGFASWSEEKDVPLARSERLLNLRYLARHGTFRTGLPPADPSGFYSSREETIALNYAKAAMVFRYVAERWGPDRAVDLYCRIASGQGGSTQAVLGISSEDFEKAWTAWLVKQVRR